MASTTKALGVPAVFVLIWSTGFIVARFGMPHSPPLHFLMWRYGLSIVCFAVWVASTRAAWPRGTRAWMHLSVTGTLMHAGYLGGVWAAVRAGLGAGTVALLVGLQPVLTAIWMSARGMGAPTRTAARVSLQQWLGLCVGLGGLVLVVWHKLGVGEVTAANLSLALLALVSITVGTLYQKRYVAPCDVRTANLVQLAAAFVITLPLSTMEAGSVDWHVEAIGAMAWSVVGLTLGGSSLLYLLIQRGAATQVASLMYLVPPCTALMAWLIFGENLTPSMLIGMAMTALGVAWVVRSS